MRKRVLVLALAAIVVLALAVPMAFAAKPVYPTVNITSPTGGATVSGAVAISADCTSGGSGVTVTGVTYAIDGGTTVAMSGPNGSASGTWTASWNSTGVTNGSHTITVEATNSTRKKKAQTITVNVSNGGEGPHDSLVWEDYPSNCLSCHRDKFNEMYQSVHYQWSGDAPDMLNQPGIKQGKINNAVNSYCINIMGNWTVCGKCHAGRGATPVATSNPTDEQLLNVDCLMCHNAAYALVRDRQSDGSMGPPASTPTDTLNGYVRNIALPIRTNCLKCHANAGGGDAVKRGDLAMAHVNTADSVFDVHMSTGRGNLACQNCHTFVNHKVTGKGSDLRVTDYAAEINCARSDCHATKSTPTGHTTLKINDHVARVACQTCHIPVYAKNASDTTATEATETHRSWLTSHSTSPPYHPESFKANNLIPKYKWWNRKSFNALLYDMATMDPVTMAFPTSRPDGAVNGPLGTKLYAFKYKTAEQPIRDASQQLIAIDTKYYMLTAPDPVEATRRGLVNMGFNYNDSFSWVITDTYQMLNHEVPPATGVLQCSNCHENTSQMNLVGELGYQLKDTQAVICSQCHGQKRWKGYVSGHSRHVDNGRWDCSWCHTFSRPERGLTMP